MGGKRPEAGAREYKREMEGDKMWRCRDREDRGFNSTGGGEPWRVCVQRRDMAGLVCLQAPAGYYQGNRLWAGELW